MIVLQIVGIVVAVVVLYLLFVAFAPVFSVREQRLEGARLPAEDAQAEPSHSRKDVTFSVKGTSISGWLYLPEDLSAPVACVIMGNGFGGTKGMLLERYAVRVRQAGFAALAFDYRHFGRSEGKPRQLVSIRRQLEDYTAAIEYARSLNEIDPARIALWGTSASGGYGIAIAAEDRKVACVCAQCPALDGRASRKMFLRELGLWHILRLVVHGQRDMMRSRFGLSAHKIPIVGKPGSLAFFPLAEAYEGYGKLTPDGFVNEVCARVILRSGGFKPAERAKEAGCPILIQICDHDSLAPMSGETEKELSKYAELKHYPIGHFEIYVGSNFEKSVGDQIEFFRKHLGSGR